MKSKSEIIMLKKSLIAIATAIALTGGAIAAAAPAAAGPAGVIEVHGSGQWKGHGHRRGAHKYKRQRHSCTPVIRWKKVGYHHRRHWKRVVVGWNCNHGRRHQRWNWRWH